MAVDVDDVREYGRFGDHLSDALLERALEMAQRAASSFASRIPQGREDDVILLLACHYASLSDRQPRSLSEGQLSVSYDDVASAGLGETTFGREVERLLRPLPRVV